MSYDLMVFEPDAAPRDRQEFMAWYGELTQWGEGHDYNDPQFTTPRVRAWYQDMIRAFPAMNGPDGVSDDEVDNPRVTDYCLAQKAAYVAFAWSEAEAAYASVTDLALKHGLGFFDVSADEGQILLPATAFDPPPATLTPSRSPWWKRLLGWK